MKRPIVVKWEFALAAVIAVYYLWYSVAGGKELSLSPELADRLKVISASDLHTNTPTSLKLGYIQYATMPEYLNLAIMNLARIKHSGSSAEGFIVVYSKELEKHPKFTALRQLAGEHSVELRAVPTIEVKDAESDIWKSSFTKFHIFNQIDYDKLIYFDADSMLVNYPNSDADVDLDELFGIPGSIDIAMARAYWLYSNKNTRKINSSPISSDSILFDEDKFDHRTNFFASHVIVFRPNTQTYKDVIRYVRNPFYWQLSFRKGLRKPADYDMEVMNKFADDQLRRRSGLKFGILDHRIYGVITGELTEEDHSKFLSGPRFLPLAGSQDTGKWNATTTMQQLKLVHFSDDPIPKPWQGEDNHAHYNTYRFVCSSELDLEDFHSSYPVNKPRITDACEAVHAWNWIRDEFHFLQTFFWVL